MTRILVIDDDEAVLGSVSRILQRAGHVVTRARTGTEGLDVMKRRFFDVAIIDYQLPSMSGVDLLQQLHEIQPACRGILMSGLLDTRAVIDGINRGAVRRVLEKPFDPDLLLETVGLVTAQKQDDGAPLSAADDEDQRAVAECLEGDFIRMAVQPIVTARDGRPDDRTSGVFAYEALLRSSHPVMNNPGRILAAAERSGMIPILADAVNLRCAAWLARLPADVRLFVNLHPLELAYPEQLADRWRACAPSAGRIVLEITERSRVLDFDAWRRSTEMLTEMGYAIAVDDLGAGYSSLSVLAELKPQFIKVDMSIVRDVDTDAHKRRIVELLCSFAATSGALLVAEGVETEPEATTLRECGADLLQGYYFGRPSTTLGD